MTIQSILPNQTMLLTSQHNQMEEAYVYWRKTKKAITWIMLLQLLIKKKSLSIDCGLLRGLLKMKTVNMTIEFKNLTPLSWEELDSESEISDATNTWCQNRNSTIKN